MGKVVNTTTGNLHRYREETLREIRSLVADITTQIEVDATRDAPMSSGGTKFISIDKRFSDNGYTGEVGVMGENDLAAYFEFGTGLSAGQILAPYPQWIKDIAWKFFVTGQGTLKGKPYLYPNVLKGIPVFQRELKTLIDKDVKDNG